MCAKLRAYRRCLLTMWSVSLYLFRIYNTECRISGTIGLCESTFVSVSVAQIRNNLFLDSCRCLCFTYPECIIVRACTAGGKHYFTCIAGGKLPIKKAIGHSRSHTNVFSTRLHFRRDFIVLPKL